MRAFSSIHRPASLSTSRPAARIVTLAAIASLLAVPLAAQQAATVPAGNVHSSGTAAITVDPDLALVTIQYSAAGRTPAIAGRAASRRANAIRAAIIALGIPSDSLPTAEMGNYWGSWGNRSQVQIRNDMRDTSYVTNDAFTVRLHNLKLVGRVIDTALTEGAQTISNVEFQATHTEAAQLEAVKRATLQARSRAAAVAEASGLTLGRVLNISVDAPPMVYSMSKSMNEGMAYARADAATTVVAPELKVSVNVSGQWELLAGGR